MNWPKDLPTLERLLEAVSNDPYPVSRVIAVARVGKNLYIGWNSSKTSPAFVRVYPATSSTNYTRHAEMHVLGKLPVNADPRKVRIYVLRLRSDSTLGIARPCDFCMRELRNFGIKDRNVYYIDYSGHWNNLGNLDTMSRNLKFNLGLDTDVELI